jgi:glutaredoxin
MEFQEPFPKNFTVYSKSGCPNCLKVKNLLKEKFFICYEINCDDYIIEDKETFLSFIENKAGKMEKMFPMVFYDAKFIGGYQETIDFINKLQLSFEDIF